MSDPPPEPQGSSTVAATPDDVPNAPTVSAQSSSFALSRTQFWLLCVAFASNLIFVPIFGNYAKTDQWGARGTTEIIPNNQLDVLGVHVSTNTLILCHASAALLLAACFLVQFILIRSKGRTPGRMAAHRTVGTVTLCGTAPLYAFFAVLLCFYVIQTPFNRVMYLFLPVMIAYGLVVGFMGYRRGDRIRHADSMFLAVLLLESAPIYRVIAIGMIKAGVQVIAPNGETIDGGAIIRTIVVLILLVVGYLSAHRLKRNLLPLGVITTVFVGSLLFLPWAWDGAPV